MSCFEIKEFDYNAVYIAVGKIIENAQKWEAEYRDCALKLGVEIQNIDRKTLTKINDKLYKCKKIDKHHFENFKKIIEIRNTINHSFFLDMDKAIRLDQDTNGGGIYNFIDWSSVNEYVNMAMDLIFEARDAVSNIANANNVQYIYIPNFIDDREKQSF